MILNALADTLYDDFRPDLESPHGSAHVWVGGWMGNVPTAPRDPTFFLLHCNVDRLWAEWIHQHQSDPGFEAFSPASTLNSSMWPWNGTAPATPPWDTAPETRRPADVLDHRALGYFYDTIDPECRPIIKFRLKEQIGKEIFKERVKEVKETFKAEIKDPKELRKEGIKEIKEVFKEGIKEIKENIKEGNKEFVKEPPDKPVKEKDKDKDLVENLGPISEVDPELLAGMGGQVTATGQPFIAAEERPAVDATGMMVHPLPKDIGHMGMPMEAKKPQRRMPKKKPTG